MSECRALTNVVGNGVATIVVSRWERELKKETVRDALARSASQPPRTAEDARDND
jgi:aerobic C4-dicarboxylate transport protein